MKKYMKLILLVILLAVALVAPPPDARAADKAAPYLILLKSIDRHDLATLRQDPLVLLGDRRGDSVQALLPPATVAALRARGVVLTPTWDWTGLPPGLKADRFHTYDQAMTTLATLADSYPALATLEELGKSAESRGIKALRIRAAGDPQWGRVQFRVVGCHHGNELMGVEVPLAIAQHLLTNYGGDEQVTRILDNAEILVAPVINPDGRVRNTRTNGLGVDLNRNYGYHWEGGSGGGSEPYSEPEVRAVVNDHLKHAYSISYSYHTSGDIVNYVWNYTSLNPPDNDAILELSNLYSDSTDYTVINGYDWYQTLGDTNDFSYGVSGDFDTTIEMADDGIAEVSAMNVAAAMECFDRVVTRGMHLRLVHVDTGEPLRGLLRFNSATTGVTSSMPGYSSSDDGTFHRYVSPGHQVARVWAPGFEQRFVDLDLDIIDVTDGFYQEIELIPLTDADLMADHPFQVFMVQSQDNNYTLPADSLGPADTVIYALGHRGQLALLFSQPCQNGEGEDLAIVPGGANTGRVSVSAAGDTFAQRYSVGTVDGSSEVRLSLPAAVTAAKLLLLVDTGIAPSGSTPGFHLDAVTCLHPDPDTPEPDGDQDLEWDAETDPDPEPDPDPDFLPEAEDIVEAEPDIPAELADPDSDPEPADETLAEEPDMDGDEDTDAADQGVEETAETEATPDDLMDEPSETTDDISDKTAVEETVDDTGDTFDIPETSDTDDTRVWRNPNKSDCSQGSGPLPFLLLLALAGLRRARRTFSTVE